LRVLQAVVKTCRGGKTSLRFEDLKEVGDIEGRSWVGMYRCYHKQKLPFRVTETAFFYVNSLHDQGSKNDWYFLNQHTEHIHHDEVYIVRKWNEPPNSFRWVRTINAGGLHTAP